MYNTNIYLEGLRKIMKTSVRIADLNAHIYIRDVPNERQEYRTPQCEI
jgi:hypothetical protein